MVNNGASTIIKAKGYKQIIEDSYLLSIDKDGDFIDVAAPILIKPSETKEVGFITRKRQMDMSTGDTLRGLFKNGEAKMKIRFGISKNGLFRNQILSTKYVVFAEFG